MVWNAYIVEQLGKKQDKDYQTTDFLDSNNNDMVETFELEETPYANLPFRIPGNHKNSNQISTEASFGSSFGNGISMEWKFFFPGMLLS